PNPSAKIIMFMPFELNIYCKDFTVQLLNNPSYKKFAPVLFTNEQLRRRFTPYSRPVAPISIPVTPISAGISHIPVYSHLNSDRLHMHRERLHIHNQNLNISLKQCHNYKI